MVVVVTNIYANSILSRKQKLFNQMSISQKHIKKLNPTDNKIAPSLNLISLVTNLG